MGELSKTLAEIKEDKGKFYLILDKFKPVKKKYTNLLYKDEQEDMYAEMELALWEAVCKIQFYDNDGQIVNYMNIALHNKFLELYKSSRNYHDHRGDGDVYEEGLAKAHSMEKGYSTVRIQVDMESLFQELPETKRRIGKLILKEELSDIEISQRMGLSRQYVNRVRRELYHLIYQKYFNV